MGKLYNVIENIKLLKCNDIDIFNCAGFCFKVILHEVFLIVIDFCVSTVAYDGQQWKS